MNAEVEKPFKVVEFIAYDMPAAETFKNLSKENIIRKVKKICNHAFLKSITTHNTDGTVTTEVLNQNLDQ